MSTTPLAAAGRAGRLRLVFARQGRRTVLDDVYAEPPFAAGHLFYPADPSLAHVILVQTTAGLFGGDDVTLEIDVHEGARVVLTSQAAQKVHPSIGGETARQHWHVRVAGGGELHGYLDPIIPFAESRLEQVSRFEVEPGGRLFWAEGLMAGRVRRGECWRFASLQMETTLRRAGELVYLDRFALGQQGTAPEAAWAMGAQAYLATLLACGVAADDERAEELQTRMFRADDGGRRGAISKVGPDMVVGRALAADGVAFARLQRAWRHNTFEVLLREDEPRWRPWSAAAGALTANPT